jgi:hypothetical protein
LPNKKTLAQIAYPDSTLPNVNEPDHWSSRQANQFLDLVWKGIDLFMKDFPPIDFTKDVEQVERDITQLLEPRIRRNMSGDEPFYVQHESWEMETRKPAPAMPPSYDIAFVMNNERLKFPIEAKVLPTDGEVSKYISDVKDAFLTCYYAPFSYEGAMLAYLLSGTTQKAFQNIEKSLNSKNSTKIKLNRHPKFPSRPHKFSEHDRQVPQGKERNYPTRFRCHHLIFEL